MHQKVCVCVFGERALMRKISGAALALSPLPSRLSQVLVTKSQEPSNLL